MEPVGTGCRGAITERFERGEELLDVDVFRSRPENLPRHAIDRELDQRVIIVERDPGGKIHERFQTRDRLGPTRATPGACDLRQGVCAGARSELWLDYANAIVSGFSR